MENTLAVTAQTAVSLAGGGGGGDNNIELFGSAAKADEALFKLIFQEGSYSFSANSLGEMVKAFVFFLNFWLEQVTESFIRGLISTSGWQPSTRQVRM
jgi:hypothetical protein